ncbi:MAG: hypothetical protein H0X27_11850 [Caulobacteraceae bacterium]|nr:hypothetical protein [Caulobacteraceae bacterium]
MKTYNLDLRHAPSKRRLNALPDNRLAPLKQRLAGDAAAIAWAQAELLEFARRRRGENFRYLEAALTELLPFGEDLDGKDYRRLGRWVSNPDGLVWRDAAGGAPDGA